MSNDRTVFRGRIFSVHEKDVDVDGTIVTAEYVRCPDAVRVYPVDAERGVVVLTRERRVDSGKVVLRPVSGRVERGELPSTAAVRELREELGFQADERDVELFATSTPMLKVRHQLHHYLVWGWKRSARRLERGEHIEPFEVHVDDLERIAFSEIEEDPVALGLLKLGRRLVSHGI